MSEPLSRRTFLKGASVAVGLGVATAGVLPGGAWASSRAKRRTASTVPKTLAYYDMSALNDIDPSDAAALTSGYDMILFIASLQGVVNESGPKLFVNFVRGDQFGEIALDEYWLGKISAPGEWLADYSVTTLSNLDDVVDRFASELSGAVVWDPNVPATSNVASTVAGVENLAVVRYDTTPGSVYSRYVGSGRPLTEVVALVNADGSSLFTGTGDIPGTTTPSSGSAKCDAYLWAKANYLDTGKTNPAQLCWYLDAYWLTATIATPPSPDTYPFSDSVIFNHDYGVANQAFFFDLCPFSDVEPNDDPGQPLGTDYSTLTAILESAYNLTNGDEMIVTHGFIPWEYKYTNYVNDGPNTPNDGENAFVQLASTYNVYLDSDAEGIDDMVNASLYQHYPVASTNPQNPLPTTADLIQAGYLQQNENVVAKRYVLLYAGDYDTAAWMYHMIPRTWDDPNRGKIPMNWPYDPNLSARFGPGFGYTRSTMTANDWFIAGDSGAGYLDPGGLVTPRASGEPSGLATWTQHCSAAFTQWDLSATGFITDGTSASLPYADLASSYGQFSPNGGCGEALYTPAIGAYEAFFCTDGFPYIQMTSTGLPSTASDAATNIISFFQGSTSAAPTDPQFYVYRQVLETPTWYMETMEATQSDAPDAAVVFLDPYSFFALIRQYLTATFSFVPNTPTEAQYLVANNGSDLEVAVQDGNARFVNGPSTWTYEFSLPPGTDGGTVSLDIANQYLVQTSTDGETWTTVLEDTSDVDDLSNRAWQTFPLPVVSTLYLRFADSNSSGEYGAWLAGLRIKATDSTGAVIT